MGSSQPCVSGQHGPSCKSDSDCSGAKDCVRCAKSGFCTDVPLPGPSPSPRPRPSPGPSPRPSPSPSAEGCTPDNSTFDYFALVQGWPNSWCLTHDCQADYSQVAYWTLHGLWPSRDGALQASYPCNCDNRQFDESQISTVEDDLNKYWQSYSDNKPFWAHEFTKHGTCAAKVSALASELDFFKTTLGLREKHDITAALKQASIAPDNSKSYSSDSLLQALKGTGGGFEPMLGCIKKNSKQYLHEITFCLDKDLNNIKCDDAVRAGGGECSDCDYSQPLFIVEPGTKPTYVV